MDSNPALVVRPPWWHFFCCRPNFVWVVFGHKGVAYWLWLVQFLHPRYVLTWAQGHVRTYLGQWALAWAGNATHGACPLNIVKSRFQSWESQSNSTLKTGLIDKAVFPPKTLDPRDTLVTFALIMNELMLHMDG